MLVFFFFKRKKIRKIEGDTERTLFHQFGMKKQHMLVSQLVMLLIEKHIIGYICQYEGRQLFLIAVCIFCEYEYNDIRFIDSANLISFFKQLKVFYL